MEEARDMPVPELDGFWTFQRFLVTGFLVGKLSIKGHLSFFVLVCFDS